MKISGEKGKEAEPRESLGRRKEKDFKGPEIH